MFSWLGYGRNQTQQPQQQAQRPQVGTIENPFGIDDYRNDGTIHMIKNKPLQIPTSVLQDILNDNEKLSPNIKENKYFIVQIDDKFYFLVKRIDKVEHNELRNTINKYSLNFWINLIINHPTQKMNIDITEKKILIHEMGNNQGMQGGRGRRRATRRRRRVRKSRKTRSRH